MAKNPDLTAEIVTFELAEGVSDAQFVSLSQQSEAYLRTSAAFLTRTLSKGSDGRWTDYVLWSDGAAALAFGADFPNQPFAVALMAAIKPGSEKMQHQSVLWQMSA